MGSQKFAIIGGGKMGEAILKGWLASDAAPAADISPADVIVVDPGDEGAGAVLSMRLRPPRVVVDV